MGVSVEQARFQSFGSRAKRLIPTPAKSWVRAANSHLQARILDARTQRSTRRRLEELLRNPPPRGERRLEFGSGPYPTPGFVHVDQDPTAVDLDLRLLTTEVALPDEWADQILAVHVLEHVAPTALRHTLRSWQRLLATGGTAEIHVPNGGALARAVLSSDTEYDARTLWRAHAGIFGYIIDPATGDDPEKLNGEPEHRLVFTWPALRALLHEAGFSAVERSQSHECRHVAPWEPYVPDFCLKVSATK